MALIYFGWIMLFLRDLKTVESRGETVKTKKLTKTGEILAVLGIFILALILRLYQLDQIPLGVWYDEAQNGNEIIKMMSQNSIQVFIPETTQMPTLFFYIAMVFVKIFGINIFALKFVSVLFGALCSLAFYFLLRVIFSDIKIALAGAFLIAVSRWHLIFSRVAFLGMLTIFSEIVVFYYYLKMLKGRNFIYGLIAGAAAGISLYSFSAADFIPVIIFVHAAVTAAEDFRIFIKYHLKNYLLLFATMLLIASPLLMYALNHRQDFMQRATDVSIMSEIREKKSLSPILEGLRLYALAFNFEGDYNGRHNLYKRPLLDEITGVLFLLGFFLSLSKRKYWFLPVWFCVMLLSGLMTVTVEAPQAYRISGVIPVIIIFALLAINEIKKSLLVINKKENYAAIAIIALVGSIGFINITQYFVVYPKEISSFMDFSPEANGISRFINSSSKEYYILVSPAAKEYGFHAVEQRVILDFTTYQKGKFNYMQDKNKLTGMDLADKKGAAVVLRDSDEEYIAEIKKYYPGAREEVFTNPFRGNTLYRICYIDKDRIIEGKENILYR